MDKLITPHHSLNDWNIPGTHSWNIYPGNYVSSPSSLRSGGYAQAAGSNIMWLKPAISGNLKDGRITTWYLHPPALDHYSQFYFRNQTQHPGYLTENGYEVYTGTDLPYLAEYVNSKSVRSWHFTRPSPFPDNTWVFWDLSWWTSLDENFLIRLTVLLQLTIGTTIHTCLNVNIPDPLWGDSDHNYVGFRQPVIKTMPAPLMDDTSVYTPKIPFLP